MDTTESAAIAQTTQTIYPAIRYRDAKAAIAWLKRLGFEEHLVCPGDGDTVAHAELKVAGHLIMLGSVNDDANAKSPLDLGGASASIYIAVDSPQDVDAWYQRAKSIGAAIDRAPSDTEYGSREFGLRDPEGHGWSFGTYRP
jgi:uncharacterized glyoxalase superfamily protein PhnB